MAYRSGGETNSEMVDNLKRFGVIRSQAVEDGLRAVDRKFFVPPSKVHLAHTDEPLRDGKLHISAPHIYGNVLEALDLTPQSSLSFLNIGSGTGYLTCIVSQILGTAGSCFAIELQDEAISHCERATNAWKQARKIQDGPHMEVIRGNGLQIDASQGEAALGFDRIYIGASIDRPELPRISDLLRSGGILVGPVGGELIKVLRLARTESPHPRNSPVVPRSFHGQAPLLSSDFTTNVLSSVRFSPLVHSPSTPRLVIPSRIWSPSLHRFYPETFRQTCNEIMLCASAPRSQSKIGSSEQHVNLAALLPRYVWIEILAYAHPNWFEQPQSEESLLKRRVQQLESSLEHAQEAQEELERRLSVAEAERELYRRMARNWQSRIERVLADPAGDVRGGAIVVMHGSGSDEEDGSEDISDNDDEPVLASDDSDDMEEDTMSEVDDTGSHMDDAAEAVVVSGTAGASSEGIARQIRAVSFSSHDL